MELVDQVRKSGASILIGSSEDGEQTLLLSRANRHGLIAGATGTGKTVTLMSLAYRLAQEGVAIFAPDVKGDLAAISKLTDTRFWDFEGKRGATIRVSVQDIGPMLFARMIEASDAQERSIVVLFAVARRHGLPLNTIDDMRRVVSYAAEHSGTVEKEIGAIPPAAASVIMGKLLMLEETGAGDFFGPTSFSLDHLLDGGVVNVLRAEFLIHNPSLYATFLFWLLGELFSALPEVGDLEKPKLIFFFDEAHLLFQNGSRQLIQKVEQVVRLIRSKGVGVFFITQSPSDVPDTVLAQLGNRIQHALRAYTPTEQKAVRSAAESFRPNPNIDTGEAIKNLGVGEALVSVLDDRGVPTVVQLTRIGKLDIPATAPIKAKPVLKLVADNTPSPAAPPPPAPPVRENAVQTAPIVEPQRETVFRSDDGVPGLIGPIMSMRDINFNFAAAEAPAPVQAPVTAPVVTKKKGRFRLLWQAPLVLASTFGWWFGSAFIAL
jgi:hypothetical protein